MKGVDREFATMFNIFDESRNWYVEENIRNYLTDKNPPPLDQLLRNLTSGKATTSILLMAIIMEMSQV